MLHGRGLYPLREVSPSVWGLPDISGQQQVPATLQFQQPPPAPPVLHSAATVHQPPQVVWSHGVASFAPHTLHHHQAVPVKFKSVFLNHKFHVFFS